MSLKPSTLEVAHKLLDEAEAEINRLRDLVQNNIIEKHLYEVDDEITIWKTPSGEKTSIKTKIVRGIRLL
jgi:hypothetical protein